MYTPSEFNPRILNQDGNPTASDTNNVRFLDPNPLGEIVPHEDLFIYVSLRAKTKSKTLLTQTSNSSVKLSQMVGNGVDMIAPLRTETTIDGSKLFKPKLQLTTDWTEIGSFRGSAEKAGSMLYQDFEGFGITNIDIEIKSQTTPKVTIDFIDVRGATLFEQGSCSPYGLFFNLPYPVFELTVKGYYGKAVNYYLNLVKFNSKFNSDTGNMECRAEFIGYSFAFLSDTIVSYVEAAQFLKESDYKPQTILREKYEQTKEFYNRTVPGSDNDTPNVDTNWCDNGVVNNRCTTITDLLKSLDEFDSTDKPEIISSPEYKELQDLIQLESNYKNYRETLVTLVRELELTLPNPITTTSNGINKNSPLKFIDTTISKALITPLINKGGVIYDYFNKSSTGKLLSNIKTILTTKIGTKYPYDLDTKIKCLLAKPEQFGDGSANLPQSSPLYDGFTAAGMALNDLPWQAGFLDNYLGYPQVKDRSVLDGYFIDLGYLIDDADRELELLNSQEKGKEGLLTKKRRDVLDAINNLVERRVGFKPTIRNIFTVLLCNTDAFMEILKNVAIAAEKHHDKEIDNKTININDSTESNTGVLSGIKKIYPWPTYMVASYSSNKGSGKTQGTKEAYPGTKYPIWPECIFVEDFIKAFLRFKDELDILNNKTEGKPGYDNYMPINPLESRLWWPNSPIKYRDVIGDEAYSIIGERLFISLDHSYFQPIRLTKDALSIPKIGVGEWNPIKDTAQTDNTITAIGQIDAWNLVNSLDNKSHIKSLVDGQFTNAQDFTNFVIESLNKGGALTERKATDIQKFAGSGFGYDSSNTYYTYKTNPDNGNGSIILKTDGGNGPILVNPNPINMADDLSKNNLIKIIPSTDSTQYSAIKITNPTFEDILRTVTGKIKTATYDLNFYTNSFTKDKAIETSKVFEDIVTTIKEQSLISFDKPQLYSTLAMSFLNDVEFNRWWSSDFNGSGGIGGNIVSNMGMISFWDNLGNESVSGINLLTIDGQSDFNKQDIYTQEFFNPVKDNTKPGTDGTGYYDTTFGVTSWKPVNVGDGVEVYTMYDGTPSDYERNSSSVVNKYGLITPLVTTPMWLDNVNAFRRVVKPGSEIDKKTESCNLAYLFLHTLKMTPLVTRLIDDDGNLFYGGGEAATKNGNNSSLIWSLRAFNNTAGVATVPKAWLLSLGAQLWRWKEFVGTKNGRWNKPLTCKDCNQGDSPSGNDPLIQPGYNSIDGVGRFNGFDTQGIPIPVNFRQDINSYLDKIYGGINGTDYNSISTPGTKSVFGSNYQKRTTVYKDNDPSKDLIMEGGQLSGYPVKYLAGSNVYFSFKYFNFYKDKIGNDLGKWLQPVSATDVVIDYSWPQTYIAPHHIPYISPETFQDAANGNGADFVFLTDLFSSNVERAQDYITMMPETRLGLNYNEIDGSVTDASLGTSATVGPTRRSKKEDGNLGMIMQHLPDSVKNQIVDLFTTWVDEEFVKLLPLIDPVNFPGGSILNQYDWKNGKESPSAIVNISYKDISNLSLKKDSGLLSLLTDSYQILNSTPKIWYGIGDSTQPGPNSNQNQFYDEFVVSKPDFEKYLESFYNEYKKASAERIKELEKQVEDDPGLSGTILDDSDTKLSLYRTFKSLTDKWISGSVNSDGGLFFNLINSANGSSCGQGVNGAAGGNKTTLASHFQYVNRVMGDIGDVAVIDITRLNELKDNLKISLYQYLTDLLVENDYLFFPLPAYVNLTGSGVKGDELLDMFRPSLLDVKDIGCGPLFLSMYVGGGSRQLKFIPKSNCPIDLEALENLKDDSFSFSELNKPSEIGDPSSVGSDGYTAFKVLYGVENQNHFKNIQLDQSEFSETAESLLVIDKLSQQGGNDQSTKGQNLNSAYLTRSYSCTIESLGNMMIQPMSYFDLVGVPMFSGAYLITEVKHNFKPNNASTTFKGVRQPRATVPVVTDVALAMNLTFKGTKKGSGRSINSISGTGGGGGSSSGLQLAGIASVPITYNGIPAQQASPLLTTNPVKPFKTSSGNPEWITLHWAAGYTYTSEYNSLKADGLAYHLSAGEDGVLYQLHSLDNVAYHAGCFRGSPSVEVPGPCKSMNSQSIGISYIGGVEDGTGHGYQRTWAEWQTEDLNYDKLGKCVGGGKFESQCKKTTYKSKKQWEAIINAILIAKAHHPTIKGITSHHLVMYDKGDVGDNFPWVELFKEIKKRSGWEPIFGDRWYDDSGNSAGLLVKEFGKSSVSAAVVASTDVQALTEYTTAKGLGNPNFNMQEIYTYLNSKISNKNLVLGIMGNMQEESGVGINNNAAGDGPKANGIGLPNGNGKYYCSWGYTQLNVCVGGGISFLKANGLESASVTEKLSALTNPSKHLDYVIDWTKTNFGGGSLPVTTTDTPESWAKKFGKEYERCKGCQDDSNGQLTKRANNATKLAGMTWS